MSKQTAQREVIRQAVEKLQPVDLQARCALLKLPAPEHGRLALRAFGTDCILTTDTFDLLDAQTGAAAKEVDRILLLHLLLCEHPLTASDELIPFRAFPGGAFYLEPFLSRSVRPLVKRYGNQLAELQKAVCRFDFQPVGIGDFSARIQTVSCLTVTLVYRLGDDEFPAKAELFFNAPVRRAFCAEDAVVLASRICLGLL
jgi:hypothetical protein